ncbi:uncharacterized protein TRUGW13939_08284 [Talaromyces rugulosus]|uniref:ABC transporter domain-containing protein n=1 Tax=Talaromyces rugulosus TaxID=121627 RepID=A0A7H8R4L9_TALRU|nr:uncharacterized protein TRUGW13939_08284 [Talaromyces rugulosus]QKX61137.1 hypothetical protein TRUGW13939_08284 [Talaromyces rugulosus]
MADSDNSFPEKDSISTEAGYEEGRENVRSSNPKGLSRTDTGVDVDRAQKDFAELSQQFSNISQQARRLSRQASKPSKHEAVHDVEQSPSSASTNGEPWDLETALHGSRAAENEAGIKHKHIGVIWDGLTVRGFGGVKTFVQTFPDAVVGFFNIYETFKSLFGLTKGGVENDILRDFRGVLKPGEMVLVLGRPGSGCTSFLKVITNQRYGYTSIDGDVNYGIFDSDTFAKKYRGEAVYNQEDDVHHPTLTVGQTLSFALDTKTPGTRPTGITKKDFKKKVIQLLLKMFNIEHTANTVVGNAFIRGVSGGERKRVSIAEMMVSSATILAWDNTTRGLDASTALDFAKSLRIMTNIYQTTTFVSLYQASENIYKQFDKVMVIDEGRQVFFGPAAEARSYFEGLGFKKKPRQTTPDYLTGCTDPFEREYEDDVAKGPSNPDELVKAFDESKYRQLLDDEMTAYRNQIQEEKHVYEEFEIAHQQAKRKFTPKSSVYSIPFYLQIWALMQRQFLVKWQDKFALTVSWVTSIGTAIILGTVWYKLPTSSAGAFTRGGLLFISLLFNAFQAFAELGSTMMGRPIVNKHRAFTFHRPSALWIAQILVDTAFAAVQILVFSIIVYFMCGLVLDAGAFFTFVLIIITGYLSMTLFFRTIGCLCPDFDYAMKFAAVIITLYVLTAGYLIQYQSEQVWLRWIFYINALGLGFAALMVNEFKRLTITCSESSLVPSGPAYSDVGIAYQSCTLQGSSPGSSVIPGSAYLSAGFSYEDGDLWRNFGIIIALIVFFLFTNSYLGEVVNWGAGGRTITFYQKENDERKKLNEELMTTKRKRQDKELEESSSELNITSKAVLTWEDLKYDVPVPGGTRRLLNSVFGYVQPGKLTALMGASGAGKTTLLDVLAARKSIGVIAGDILIDGKPPGASFQRGTAYAEQLDVHESTQTVREALRFSAELRQPYHVPLSEKHAYVEEILSLLELETLADAIIGFPEFGLSVEERKRVTIGVELAAKPELLLFLDEPTSGLDSQSAFNIVRFLRKLSAAGQAILCTIHQPNSALFQSFDRLLLLQRGGECVYFGDIGQDSQVLINYFRDNGAECPPDANPAEWMLDAIGAGQTPRIGDRDWGDIWRDSPELAKTKADIVKMKKDRIADNKEDGDKSKKEVEYATPTWFQIRTVVRRTNLAFWRSPNYGFTRLFTHAAIALLTGLAFLQLDDSRSSLQYRVFVLFQITVIPAIIIQQVEPKYDMSRLVSYRESASKTYRSIAFATAMVVAEVPYNVLCSVVFFLPIYYIPGFMSESSRAGYQFFMVLITEFFAVTLGQLISALTSSSYIASQLNPPFIIVFALFCGVAIPKPQIPKFWRAWLYQLDPFTRLIGGMLVTELHGREVHCTQAELNSFPAPGNQTCGEYMEPYFAAGGPGYIVNNITQLCEYCAYKVGDEFYSPFELSFDNRWRDLGIFAAFIASNIIILFIGSRLLNFNKR